MNGIALPIVYFEPFATWLVNQESGMKTNNNNNPAKETGNKPFIPKPPDSKEEEKQDPNVPSPESDPNYSYYPNMAFPTAPEPVEQKNADQEEEKE